MTDSIYEKIGSAEFPLKASDISDTIAPDPLRDTLLAMFKAAINAELNMTNETPWTSVAAGTPLAGTNPVADEFPGLPTPDALLARKSTFPTLYLGRVGAAQYEQTTILLQSRTQQWDLTWVLGPLTIGDEEKLKAFYEIHVPSLVAMICRHRYHPSYNSGAVPFTTSSGVALDAIRMVNADASPVEFGEKQTTYHGVTMRLETIETDAMTTGAFGELDGMDVDIAVGNATELVPDLVSINTDHDGS